MVWRCLGDISFARISEIARSHDAYLTRFERLRSRPGLEFGTNLRRERQLEGIAAAKQRGFYKGCKLKIDPKEVRRLHAEEQLRPSAIARRLGIARSSVYRFLPGAEPASVDGDAATSTTALGKVAR